MNRLIDPSGLSRFEEIRLSHGRVYVSLSAPGPVLLFVHGGYHGAWCWQTFMTWFENRGQACAAVDVRGHGGLAQDEDFPRQGLADYAADVVEAAQAIDRPVIFVGHSLGGLVCMLAARNVDHVGQILMAPSPPGQLEGLELLPAYPEDGVVMPPSSEVARGKFLAGYEGEIDSLIARLCPESPRAMNDRYRLRIKVDPAWGRGPTLCLSAGHDSAHLHPPGQDQAVARFFGGKHQMRPHSGHDMMLDNHWQDTAVVLSNWLQSEGLTHQRQGVA